ncbi:ABC transporter ATP-binding protein [Prolixibacteraceae bacterium JC049]|nr:ABC transporter ATP-binding protein [Prolixibacteraceae bacterium JC049]
MESVITCKNLTHYYGNRCIYENLSFEVPKGRVLGLLGKNGTGKTTTINILNGYLTPRSGDCLMFGEPSSALSPDTKRRIGLLIEGHIQYSFMNIQQIEKFYSQFYPNWKKEPYYELMSKLKIAPKQRISRMSCGQRSQVALGLILAQDPELLILDDFSLGLDPGYRRLFVDYMNEYVRAQNKTVFVTSHIIQDMERLIDDCLILDYGKILLQESITDFVRDFKRYHFTQQNGAPLPQAEGLYHPEQIRNKVEFHSFLQQREVEQALQQQNIEYANLSSETLTLEEAFIGLTGKY